MNKTEFVETVSEVAETTKASATRMVDAVFETIASALQKGDSVTFPGFGTFTVSHRSARTGRNPQTGEPIEIGAKTVPAFKAGKKLKDVVQEG